MRILRPNCVLGICAAIVGLAACNSSSSSFVNGGYSAQPATASSPSPIQHVVIVVQENRTFNDFFATYPGADGTTVAQAEPNSNCSPPILSEQTVYLAKMPLVLKTDLDHKFSGYFTAWDGGKLDGFDKVPNGKGIPECLYPYQYTDPADIQPYWSMAQQYTLAEHMFTTQGSDSFTAHQDLIRGGTLVSTGRSMVDLPSCSGTKCKWGCDAPPGTHTSLITQNDNYTKYRGKGPFPCSKNFKLTYPTLRDLLDAKAITWKYYVPPMSEVNGKLFNAFDAIAAVRYGSEWSSNISSPETNVITDAEYGTLPEVSWVVPDAANSDHPGEGQDTGPSWVASVVNAIGESSYWNSTAIIVVWDDWGGLFDNQGLLDPKKYGYGGLGLRVPAIVISPYAKAGYISTTQYEFGSILKYIEQNWNLGSLGTTDQRANSIIDCFNYSQSPIQFKPIQASRGASYFLREKHSNRGPDSD
jgi:phospholipase C